MNIHGNSYRFKDKFKAGLVRSHDDNASQPGGENWATLDNRRLEGQREVLGVKVGASEAEPFRTEFLRSLNRRGLSGVTLVIIDSHEGIKAAAAKVLKATWQRCRVNFMRNALAFANKTQRRMVSAAIGTVFVQDSPEAAKQQWCWRRSNTDPLVRFKSALTQWRSVADLFREKMPKIAACMDEAENDVQAFMTFPRSHWARVYSKNPLERLNAEIKRRTNVVGIFPNECGHHVPSRRHPGAERRVVAEPALHDARRLAVAQRYCRDSAARSGTLSM